MAINISQQVDYLWKKIGFGLAKTDTANAKLAINESISSSLLMAGDKIWTQSDLIPAVIPENSGEIVEVYNAQSAIQCTPDLTAAQYKTWLAGSSLAAVLKDWIPPEFGSTYLIKVYLADATSTDPVNDGIQLFSQGSEQNDEWFFDYQAGILHFIGENLPPYDFANKAIFITGARYVGIKGLGNLVVGKFGNLLLQDNTISSINTDGNITISPNGNGVISANDSVITDILSPTNPGDAVNLEYLDARFATLKANTIIQGNSSVVVSEDPLGNVIITIDNVLHSYYDSTGFATQNTSISGSTISSTVGDLVLSGTPTDSESVVRVAINSALTIPVGNTNQRPIEPDVGAIRFNVDSNLPEYYNGMAWVGMQGAIVSQIIEPDGALKTYALNQAAAADGVLVSINGTLQQPGRSYLINNQQITFAETPQVTDIIEVRFIAAQVVVDQKYDTPTEIKTFGLSGTVDQFDATVYRSAKYTASVTDSVNSKYSIVDIYVIHDGNIAYVSSSRTGTIATNDLLFSAEKQSNTVILAVSSTSNSNALYLQKTYFPI